MLAPLLLAKEQPDYQGAESARFTEQIEHRAIDLLSPD